MRGQAEEEADKRTSQIREIINLTFRQAIAGRRR